MLTGRLTTGALGGSVPGPEEHAIARKRPLESRPVLAESRRRAIAETLKASGAVTVAEVEARFGVSPMTARRDLAELERRGVVRRTHGGAVLPATSAHEDSFARRLRTSAAAKEALAAAAVAGLASGESVFLDSSTTSYFVARAIVETGLAATVLTNSLPVMELVQREGSPELELIGVGGTLRRLTRSFVGPYAVRMIQGHFADRVLFSVKGLAGGATLTEADPLEAEVKRAMIAQAGEATLLVDGTKFDVRGLSVIAPVTDVTGVLAHGLGGDELAALRAAGATVRAVDDASDGRMRDPART
jgi:DeoR/GlpR family transcriptional regulator of sugar metabolism